MRTCPKCAARYADEISFCPNDGTGTVPVVRSEPAEAPDPFVGQVIDGRYRIEKRIGEGGMGVVYRATHVVLKKPLAIKVMRGEQANDPEVVQRFVQEARSSSAIGHPNIVSISDFGTTGDGAVYFAMEFLQGQTLGQAMERGQIEAQRAFAIFIQIAAALEAAHQIGIVHRDLKPDNIFLKNEPDNPDFVKVLDFGIAKVKNAAAKITRTGMVFGTPHYMSPEQAAGQSVDHRSDIYSLGVILYQVFAGQLPFEAESYMGVMTKHMFEAPPLPSRHQARLRGSIEDIILQTLHKKPEQRYQTMQELREDLERAQSGQPARASLSSVAPVSMSPPSMSPLSMSPPSMSPPRSGAGSAEHAPGHKFAAFDTDDEPVALPKKRPVWLFVLAGIVVLGIVALTFSSLGGSTHEPAADASVLRPAPVEAPPPSAAGAGGPASALAAQAEPAANPVPPAQVVRPNAAVPARPRTPASPAQPARTRERKKSVPGGGGKRTEVVDPWQ